MLDGFPIMRLAGVELRISLVLVAVLAVLVGTALGGQWFGVSESSGFLGHWGALVLLLAFLTCTLLHELGHASAGAGLGLTPRRIVLSLVGLTYFSGNVRKPQHEGLIAIAGPAANLLIAAALVPWSMDFASLLINGDPSATSSLVEAALATPAGMVGVLGLANIAIAALNLIPALPLDGGRLLVGLLAGRMEREKAIRITARIGVFLAACGLGAAAIDWWMSDEIAGWHIVAVALGGAILAASLRETRQYA